MTIRLIWAVPALVLLAGCGDDARDYPALLPTDQVLAEPALPGHIAGADVSGAGLTARGQALSGRAARPASGDADLQRRASALRERAKALAAQSLDDPPDCTGDQPDCAPATTE